MAGKITNEISIRSKVTNAASQKKYVGLMRNAMNTKVIAAKQEMLYDFDNHPVTKELLQNPAKEGSEFINYGNLVTLIGFEDASIDVGIVRNILEYQTELSDKPSKISANKTKINYTFTVDYPSMAEIEEATPTPDGWSSASWVRLIERGISNAVRYIFSSKGLPDSRSGFGLQTKKSRGVALEQGTSFNGVKYISEILDNFRKKFQ